MHSQTSGRFRTKALWFKASVPSGCTTYCSDFSRLSRRSTWIVAKKDLTQRREGRSIMQKSNKTHPKIQNRSDIIIKLPHMVR
jgi:hypothetical protein